MTYYLINLQYQKEFNHAKGLAAMLYLMKKSLCAAPHPAPSGLVLICSFVKKSVFLIISLISHAFMHTTYELSCASERIKM